MRRRRYAITGIALATAVVFGEEANAQSATRPIVALIAGGSAEAVDPPTGTAYWFLVRSVNNCGIGTYGTPLRDSDILACF